MENLRGFLRSDNKNEKFRKPRRFKNSSKKYSFPKGMMVEGGILSYKDRTPTVLDIKSHRDLIFVTKEQNGEKNPVGIQCF